MRGSVKFIWQRIGLAHVSLKEMEYAGPFLMLRSPARSDFEVLETGDPEGSEHGRVSIAAMSR